MYLIKSPFLTISNLLNLFVHLSFLIHTLVDHHNRVLFFRTFKQQFLQTHICCTTLISSRGLARSCYFYLLILCQTAYYCHEIGFTIISLRFCILSIALVQRFLTESYSIGNIRARYSFTSEESSRPPLMNKYC